MGASTRSVCPCCAAVIEIIAVSTRGASKQSRGRPLNPVVPHAFVAMLTRNRVAMLCVLLVAAFANLFQIRRAGFGFAYQNAAIASMLTSWHAFFFAAFDAGGFVSVDKPPLGLWIQAASAKLLGFSAFSLVLPQAVAGILSVAILYHLVSRMFGVTAGAVAALALAITPISVATNRNTVIDSQLVVLLLLAAWAVSRATWDGRLRYLLLSAILVGLGFDVKMLAAYLVLPSFALLYLIAAPLSRRTQALHLVLAALVVLIISFAWVATVDLIPAAQRPYVGSSDNNTELSLVLQYNGLNRLSGSVPHNSAITGSTETAAVSDVPGYDPGTPGPLRLNWARRQAGCFP